MFTFEELDKMRDAVKAGTVREPGPEDEGEGRRACTALVDSLAKHPVVQQYLRHLGGAGRGLSPKNTVPWMALGEMYYCAMLSAWSAETKKTGVVITGGDERLGPAGNGMVMAMRFLTAQPYLWTQKIHQLVESSPLPSHVIGRDLLPYPRIFWSFEAAHDLKDEHGMIIGGTDFVLITDEGDGLMVIINITKDDHVDLKMSGLKYGERFPDDIPELARQSVAFYLKGLAFLASPFVEVQRHALPRQWRRHASGPGVVGMDTRVHVVVLRRAAQDAVDAERAASQIEYKHQWWVSGHYRAQWYPSAKGHKVIWIAPHLKGPPDAPVLQKVYSVQR